MNFFDIWWLAWLGPLFLVVELTGAAKATTGKTLSEHVWHWFSVFEHRPWWPARRAALFAFMGVLTAHFMVGLHAWPWLICSSVPLGAVVIYSSFFEEKQNDYVDPKNLGGR